MCGIFAIVNDQEKKAAEKTFFGLKQLEYRGYDSWGIVAKKENNQLFIKKDIGKLPSKKPLLPSSIIALGHTRWATHGGIKSMNSHPHWDCQKNIFVVHNGIIENYQLLKRNLIKKNHHFSSETDSEIIAHLFEEELKKITLKKEGGKIISQIKKFAYKIFEKIKGLNAFIVFFSQFNLLLAFKNSSPIVFGTKNRQFYLASDANTLAEYTEKVYFLEDNELLIIFDNHYHLFDKRKKEKLPQFLTLNIKKSASSLGQFPHFLIKEIYEQPQVINQILHNQKEEIKNLATKIKESYGNYFIGCGTAYYAALSGTYLFSKIAHRHTNAAVASEFSYLVNFLTSKSLVITLSQSGETIDIISSVKKIKEKGGKVFAITNVLGSTLYRMADYKILLNAGPEKAVVATKSFTAKVAILILLAYALKNNQKDGINNLKKSAGEVEKILKNQTKIKQLAKKIKNKEHLFILGRGLSYPIALETALKIKEVSYLHAEGFAAGELKHGVIALIDKNTPIIIYNPEDETYQDTLSSAFEVKSRGGYLIGISSKPNSVYDEFIKVENCQEANLIPYAVIGQLIGYHLAVLLKRDPDKPRNLAKSVTVK